MQFTFEQLSQFAVGNESSEVVDGAWRVHRLPARLRGAYDDPPRFGVRRDCPSSVRLRFVTDSRRIELSMRLGAEAHPAFHGAVKIDSAEPSAFGPEKRCKQWQGNILNRSDQVMRMIDVWLPHLCMAEVLSVQVDDGSEVRPAPPLRMRWLAYGDSITQGFCSSLPTTSVIGRCALALNAAVHNLAVGGSSLYPALADALPDGRYDLVTIAYGVCDFQSDVAIESFQGSARRLIDALHHRHPCCPIVLVTPIVPASDPGRNGRGLVLQDYRDALRKVGEAHPGVSVVAGEDLVEADARLFEDWVHPNDRGFGQYSGNLLPHLLKARAEPAAPR